MNEMLKKILEVQKEIVSVEKDSKNPFFHSDYVSLNAVLAATRENLNSKGLLLIQRVNFENSTNFVETMIQDVESDTNISCRVPFVGIKNMQEMGSAITYARRYGLISLLSLSQLDDDAEASLDRNMKVMKPQQTVINKAVETQKEKGNFSGFVAFLECVENLKDLESTKKMVEAKSWREEELERINKLLELRKAFIINFKDKEQI